MTAVSSAGIDISQGTLDIKRGFDLGVEILDDQLPLLARLQIDDSHAEAVGRAGSGT